MHTLREALRSRYGHLLFSSIGFKGSRLMNDRFQRQNALSMMRRANKAYNLSNPPSWFKETRAGMRKGFHWLRMRLKKNKQHLPRVGPDN